MSDYSGIAMEALRAGGFGPNAEAYRASGLSAEYGVRFHDGSVKHPWNGRTQEQRAREDLERLQALFPNDNITLVWRPHPSEPWQPAHD